MSKSVDPIAIVAAGGGAFVLYQILVNGNKPGSVGYTLLHGAASAVSTAVGGGGTGNGNSTPSNNNGSNNASNSSSGNKAAAGACNSTGTLYGNVNDAQNVYNAHSGPRSFNSANFVGACGGGYVVMVNGNWL